MPERAHSADSRHRFPSDRYFHFLVIQMAMQPAFLILTDDEARSHRLVRDLGSADLFTVRDIFDGSITAGQSTPTTVLSDVDLAHTAALVPLRRFLADARKNGAPFLCLLRTDSPRARIQATALGASQILAVGASVQPIRAALKLVDKTSSTVSAPVMAQLTQVKASIAQMLTIEEAPAPDAAEATTGLLLEVVAEVGVSEWLELVWQFDDMTHQHCMLVAGLAGAFGGVLGFGLADRHRLTKSALLHDVGKARIPKDILNKPGALDDAERDIMRRHAEYGHEMLIGKGYSDEILAVVRSHHEMLDGSGYPDGLKGPQIPDLVRLVTICDIYAALIERRPYRAPMSGNRAYGILEGMQGKLDMAMLRAFRPISLDNVDAGS